MQAHDFRVCFTPLFEVLFTFPSRYWFAIGLSVVFSLAGWSPRIRPGFLVSRLTQVPHWLRQAFAYGALTLCGSAFQRFLLTCFVASRAVLQPRRCLDTAGLGSCAFARHYSRNHFCFLFLRVLRCFSSPGSPRALRGAAVARGRLPHSDTCGSKDICSSPQLFAACHVLLRLREPRHPSCALVSFLFSFFAFYLLARSI